MGDRRSEYDRIPTNVAPDQLIMCNRATVDEKAKEFRYLEGIYLSALRILRDDLLSIRRLFIAAAKLIFAVSTTCIIREYLVCTKLRTISFGLAFSYKITEILTKSLPCREHLLISSGKTISYIFTILNKFILKLSFASLFLIIM